MNEEFTYLFMGYTLPSDEKKKMDKRFKELRSTLIEKFHVTKSGEDLRIAVEKRLLIAFYNDEEEMKTIRHKFQTSNYEHGVTIGVEKDKTIWPYDNGNKIRVHLKVLLM